jgi:non-ribosomal peptide synthetase-like protein
MSAVFVSGLLLVGLVFVGAVPRLLNLFIEPDKVYRLYGLHYGIHRAIGLFTNLRFFLELFGNSSYILHYLRWLGYDVSLAGQTGCNFGTEVRHETPFAVTVGDGTMVADGLSIINADFSNSSFKVSRASIGAHSFLGNLISYPSQSRTGENCLLATRVLVPTGGEVRENTGLLGAPSFTIPRSVQRDGTFDHLKSQEELRHHLRAKNSYNRRTMGAFLLAQWGFVFGLAVLELPAAEYYDRHRTTWIAVSLVFPVLWALVYRALCERLVTRFRSLRPQFCSVYDPYYWWHERYWKFIMTPTVAGVLNGTPFKNILWRLLGLRIGERVFDDGSSIPERTLVTVGDGCVINQNSVIQGHSLEDGAFKSQRTVVGAGCTLGVGAFIHYGVTVGDGAELAAGSFLMKGGEVLAGERWGGNPAQEMSGQAALPAARPADSRILAPAGAIPAPVPADAIPAPRTDGRHRGERRRTAADR